MRQIEFQTLKLEGFGNIKRFKVFKLNLSGLNIIRGKNGAGKTTYFSGLSWVLFGVTLKKNSTVETWEHVRPENWSGTMGSVSFNIGSDRYKVTRCKDYQKVIDKSKGGNRLIFLVNGEPSKFKDKRDIQSHIESVLGMSHALFTNSLVFQQKGVRFIEQPGPEKKKILEESFKLTWVTELYELAKADKQYFESRVASITKEWEKESKNLNELEKIYKEMETLKSEFELKKTQDIETITKRMAEIKAELKKESKDEEINSLYQEIQDLNTQRVELEVQLKLSETNTLEKVEKSLEITRLKLNRAKTNLALANKEADRVAKELKEIVELKKEAKTEEAVCYACKSLLKKNSREEVVKTLSLKAATLKESYKDDRKELEKQIDALDKEVSQVNNILTSLGSINRNIQFKEEKKGELLKDSLKRESLKGEEKGLKANLQKARESEYSSSAMDKMRPQILLATESVESLKVNQAAFRTKVKLSEWAMKDPLSNTGIKAFLFHKLLDKLNHRLLYYESFTGFGISLMVDMASGRKSVEAIITYQGAPVSFHDLSGGESQLVNVIIALASSDVLLSDTMVNLRVFDEVSEHLDKENTELMMGFLQRLAEKFSVYIITHNNQVYLSGANEIKIKTDEQD